MSIVRGFVNLSRVYNKCREVATYIFVNDLILFQESRMSKNYAPVWLYIMRTVRGLSQRGLAAKVGLTHTLVSEAESGNASAETWAKLAVYFKTSTDAVLWLAGVVDLAAPPKQEIVSRIERIMDEMEPETRKKAEQLIEWINKAT
jgi:transcriptional regulator with XRE-family HTH domain